MTVPLQSSQDDTRLRLLRAAGEIFAEHGFRNATVRDICEKADANVAAVNYHFGDKSGLYAAVVTHYFAAAWDKHPPDGGIPSTAPATDRLEAFIRSWLWRMMDSGAPAWYGRLMAREMAEPTPAVTEAIVESHIRPHSQLLQKIVAELLPDSEPQEVAMTAMSIAGQCLFYFHCRDMIHRLGRSLGFSPNDPDQIARHITEFSMCAMGLKGATKQPSRAPKRNGYKSIGKRSHR